MDNVYRVKMTVEVVVYARNEKEAREQAIEYGSIRDAVNLTCRNVLSQDDLPDFYSINSQPENGIGYSIQDHLDQKA